MAKTETFCSVCGPLDAPGVHNQPDCLSYAPREFGPPLPAGFAAPGLERINVRICCAADGCDLDRPCASCRALLAESEAAAVVAIAEKVAARAAGEE